MNMKAEHLLTHHQFESPTVIKHGIGSISNIDEESEQLGISKVLLVRL